MVLKPLPGVYIVVTERRKALGIYWVVTHQEIRKIVEKLSAVTLTDVKWFLLNFEGRTMYMCEVSVCIPCRPSVPHIRSGGELSYSKSVRAWLGCSKVPVLYCGYMVAVLIIADSQTIRYPFRAVLCRCTRHRVSSRTGRYRYLD